MKTRTPISDYYQFKQRLQGPEKESENDNNLFLKEKKKRSEKSQRSFYAQRV